MGTKRAQLGSAMIELIIGLVSIVALFAGLVQMVSISRARHDTQYEARSEAGAESLSDLGALLSDAEYIEDWDAGNDDRRHTRDDYAASGDSFAFNGAIVEMSSPDSDGWTIIEQAPGDQLSMLRSAPNPAQVFGLVEGTAEEDVPLLPAVQSLLYDADSIEIESRVWMTWTRGIY
ncbi:MAG: hypothetical protein ISS31_06215 [Kiritimatiellae bacterium]|nr:hypothetical protein [Kiritimatiellia bacterium]